MLTKDRAICIRVTDYSETSQVATLYARLSGKIRVIAKGSKRPRSAFDGPIEVLSRGDIVFSDTHTDKLMTLTEFQQRPARGGLRRNLFALHSALLAAELLNALTHEFDPHLVLFDGFTQFIQDMEEEEPTESSRDILLRLILFQLVLLREVGLQPILKTCANCKRPFTAGWREGYFSSTANGLICRDCEMSFPDKVRLTMKAAQCLADLNRIAAAPDSLLDEIERLLIHHFTQTLGRRPKMARHILHR